MKTTTLLLTLTLPLTTALFAHDDHDHDKGKAGPNGGRVLQKVEPHAEFFVREDRHVQITFLDKEAKTLRLEKAQISATGGDRKKPTRLSFKADGALWVSAEPLPEGKAVPIILQIRPKPEAKRVTERFTVNLADCPTCDYLEYACVCAHAGEDDGHKH